LVIQIVEKFKVAAIGGAAVEGLLYACTRCEGAKLETNPLTTATGPFVVPKEAHSLGFVLLFSCVGYDVVSLVCIALRLVVIDFV
jgi:hypothetical protein